jgi:hypothetical protein
VPYDLTAGTLLRLALRLKAVSRQDGFEIGFMPGPPAVQRLVRTDVHDRLRALRPRVIGRLAVES